MISRYNCTTATIVSSGPMYVSIFDVSYIINVLNKKTPTQEMRPDMKILGMKIPIVKSTMNVTMHIVKKFCTEFVSVLLT